MGKTERTIVIKVSTFHRGLDIEGLFLPENPPQPLSINVFSLLGDKLTDCVTDAFVDECQDILVKELGDAV